jgi:hypothetical protein
MFNCFCFALSNCFNSTMNLLYPFHGTFTHLQPDMHVESDLSQQIAPLPQFSFLEICLRSYGHPFGAMMLNLLGTCTDIRRLKIVMGSEVILQSGYLIYSNLFKRAVLYILQTSCFWKFVTNSTYTFLSDTVRLSLR